LHIYSYAENRLGAGARVPVPANQDNLNEDQVMQNEESALKMLEERVGSLGEANLMDTLA